MGRWILKQDGYALLTQNGKFLQGDDLTVNLDEPIFAYAEEGVDVAETLMIRLKRWKIAEMMPLSIQVIESLGTRSKLG